MMTETPSIRMEMEYPIQSKTQQGPIGEILILTEEVFPTVKSVLPTTGTGSAKTPQTTLGTHQMIFLLTPCISMPLINRLF